MSDPVTSSPATPVQPRGAMRIGRISGIPVYLSSSWFFGILILGILFYGSFTPGRLDPSTSAVLTAAALVALVISVLAHETAHALVARRLGERVHHVTLTPWGGYTYATTYHPRPLPTALVAVVGPITNLILWLLLSGLGELMPTPLSAAAIEVAAWINLGLGLFNILPGLPLDGGHVVEAIAWAITGNHTRGIRIAAWAGRVLTIGIVAWFVLPTLTRSGSVMDVMWTILIGLMMWQSASAGLQMARARESLDRVLAAGVSRPALLVGAGTLLRDAYAMAPDLRTTLLVWDGAQITGWVPPVVLDEAAANSPVDSHAQPCAPQPLDVTIDTPVTDIAIAMTMEHQTAVPLRLPTGEPRLLAAVDLEQAAARAS